MCVTREGCIIVMRMDVTWFDVWKNMRREGLQIATSMNVVCYNALCKRL